MTDNPVSPSSSSAAMSYLLEIQRQAWRVLGKKPLEEEKRCLAEDRVTAMLLEQKAPELPPSLWIATLGRDPRLPQFFRRGTPYEDPKDIATLAALHNDVMPSIDERGLEMGTLPLVGTLPTHSLDPLIVVTPGSTQRLLAVEPEMMTFANQLAKAIAQLFVSGEGDGSDSADLSPGDWAATLRWEHPALTAFADLALATLAGRPGWSRPSLPRPSYQRLAKELCRLIELFLLARGYAHLAAGDIARAPAAIFAVPGSQLETRTFSLEQEFQADVLALDLLVGYVRREGTSLDLLMLAVEALLATLSILEAGRTLLSGGPAAALPPSTGRHEVRQRLVRYLAALHDGERGTAARFAQSLQPAFHAMWEIVAWALSDPEMAGPVREPGLYTQAWSTVEVTYDETAERLASLTASRHETTAHSQHSECRASWPTRNGAPPTFRVLPAREHRPRRPPKIRIHRPTSRRG